MNLKLHVIFEEQADRTWVGLVEDHPYIYVDYGLDLDSTKELLNLHIAEELAEKYRKDKRTCRWAVTKESIFNLVTGE